MQLEGEVCVKESWGVSLRNSNSQQLCFWDLILTYLFLCAIWTFLPRPWSTVFLSCTGSGPEQTNEACFLFSWCVSRTLCWLVANSNAAQEVGHFELCLLLLGDISFRCAVSGLRCLLVLSGSSCSWLTPVLSQRSHQFGSATVSSRVLSWSHLPLS